MNFTQVWNVLPEIEQNRPTDPHWYLDMLGVNPSHVRRGLGSALLRYGLSRCDASNQPAVLDAMSMENVSFYERHGFEVTSQVTLSSGLFHWTMIRPSNIKP